MSLSLLLHEGLLAPGDGVLSVDYKQRRTLADLCGDGRIKCACAFCRPPDPGKLLTSVLAIDEKTQATVRVVRISDMG